MNHDLTMKLRKSEDMWRRRVITFLQILIGWKWYLWMDQVEWKILDPMQVSPHILGTDNDVHFKIF